MPDLSVIIPARNEEWLNLTLQDVLSHIEADTEIIVILDGAWPNEPLPQHERVQIVYLPESIGQRAATNLGAKISTAQYVMKLDAHCAVAQGFDRVLIESAKELGDDVTQIPAQHNLHIYDRICDKCGKREYQGSMDAQCVICGPTTWKREIIWNAERRRTEFWRFDTEPKFAYWGAFKERPEAKQDIVDAMTSLGACFFISRKRFWEIDGFDVSYGIWGSYAIELSLKSWLSGGRHVTNRKTWFSHLFRVGGLSFPYSITGAQQEHARQRTRDIWYHNAWPKQVRPLSWLIEKFAPIPSWHDESGREVLGLITAAGETFYSQRSSAPPLPFGATNATDPHRCAVGEIASGSKQVSVDAVSFGAIDGRDGVTPAEIVDLQDQAQVGGVTAGLVLTGDMVQDRDTSAIPHRDWLDQPCEQDAVWPNGIREDGLKGDLPVAVFIKTTDPNPTAFDGVNLDSREYAGECLAVDMRDSEILSVSHASTSIVAVGLGPGRIPVRSGPSILPELSRKGIVAYTDNSLDSGIATACLSTVQSSGLPFVAVSLKPIPGLTWAQNVVLDLERGYLTMFRQILTGLQEIDTEFVFFAEHDVAYHPSHWDFTPPNSTQVFYNQNVWKVDSETGRALHYLCSQTSGLCANRELLLEHYRKRVDIVERSGFSRKMGFEPGTHRRSERVDDLTARTWMSEYPNVDIRHGQNLTPSRWKKEQFRDQRYTKGWTESDSIPGWGVTKGRFREFLREAAHGAVQQAVA